MKNKFDVIIIGGGASGLMCAISAKRNNPKLNISLLEKNDRVGKKLLSTGSGRCNLTNANVSPERYTGSFTEFLPEVLERYDTDKLLKYFEELGLMTCRDGEGRYYPVSKQASSVLDVLRYACERLGVNILCSQDIHSLNKTDRSFCIKTADSVFESEKLVICCGSKAAPKLGGSASGADILKNLGHTVIPFSPALCPVRVESKILKSLKGLRASGSASLIRNGKTIKTESGEIQFTEDALSGICVFDLSVIAKPGDTISLDLLDFISEKELYCKLANNRNLFADLTADCVFTGIMQKRLAQAILKQSGVNDFSRLVKDMSDSELEIIAKTAKNMSFTVVSNAGFDKAQCALGGVKGGEIDPKTMKSRKVNGLYVCGEAIDICGECGGFNLHFAFASGIIAGESL